MKPRDRRPLTFDDLCADMLAKGTPRWILDLAIARLGGSPFAEDDQVRSMLLCEIVAGASLACNRVFGSTADPQKAGYRLLATTPRRAELLAKLLKRSLDDGSAGTDSEEIAALLDELTNEGSRPPNMRIDDIDN